MRQLLKKVPHYRRVSLAIGLTYSILICFHFFGPGYLWSLDYFFPLFGGMLSPGSNGFILPILTTLSQSIISSQVLEKVIVLAAFFIPFVGGAYLTKKSQSIGAMVFAGIAITCNPYFYARFMDGQLGMYLLFCTIPFWLISLSHFFSHENKNITTYMLPIILSLITTSISMHGARFLFVSGCVFFLVFWDKQKIGHYIKKSLLLAGSILLANLYWIIPNLTSEDGAQAKIDDFGNVDIAIFQNHTPIANNYITTLSLQGYRGEGSNRFVPSYGDQKYPFVLFFLLFGFILVGIVYSIGHKGAQERKFAIGLLVLTILGYIFGLGTTGDTIFAGINNWLYTHMPFYVAMRESHKWVLLMVIGYAYFGAYGLHALGTYFGHKKYHYGLVAGSAIMILIAYTPSIFLVAKYIPVKNYPEDRYDLRQDLLKKIDITNPCGSDTCYDMLVFPWHQYMHLSFVGKNVLNPTEIFFAPLRVLAGDNIEIGELYAQGNSAASRFIVRYLSSKGIAPKQSVFDSAIDDQNFVQSLKKLDIQYILLLKEVDHKAYESIISNMIDKKLATLYTNTEFFTVYKIR